MNIARYAVALCVRSEDAEMSAQLPQVRLMLDNSKRAVARPFVSPRSFSIASRTPRARNSISISGTVGLATVSISAAVSPKSLIQVIGPAP